jgi:3-oxoacyl-[acyl-carrier protein] reductase
MKSGKLQVDLSGKIALVTGGAKGIGRALAVALAESNATVVVNYCTSEKPAREMVETIPNIKLAVRADVAIPEDVEKMMAQIKKEIGDIDILVNNAGTQLALSTVEEMPVDLWKKVFDINLTSCMVCSKLAIPGMKKKGWGRIINISSISARSGGGPGGTHYASSKGAMTAFTKGLAKELGPAGITVNAIAPGVILTEIHEKFSTRENLENLRKMTPLARLGQPEDIAGAVLFLASDAAAYMTGETVSINGGLRMD